MGSCYIVNAAGRSVQRGCGDAGAIFAGHERRSSLLCRPANHAGGVEHVEKHVHVKRVAKYGERESGRREVLLAQGVIAGERIFRFGRTALERQIHDMFDARTRRRFEGISVQQGALAWLGGTPRRLGPWVTPARAWSSDAGSAKSP